MPHPDAKEDCWHTLYKEQPLPALQAACPIRQQQGGCNGPTYDLRISTQESYWQQTCNPCRAMVHVQIHNAQDRQHVHRAEIILLFSGCCGVTILTYTEPLLACVSHTVM